MKSIWLGVVGSALVAMALAACSEANDATDGSTSPPIDAGQDATPDVGLGHDATVTPGVDTGAPPQTDTGVAPTPDTGVPHDTGTTPTDTGAPGAGQVVLNEISGKDPDYVELYNPGTVAVDLSGWGVTEAKDSDAGVPGNPKTPVLFAPGTTLAPGAYALALGAPKDGGTVLDPCPASTCVQSTWNISSSSGATVTLLNASGATSAEQAFPKSVTGSGQSWGRLPNGTGTFSVNTQTPGLANSGP